LTHTTEKRRCENEQVTVQGACEGEEALLLLVPAVDAHRPAPSDGDGLLEGTALEDRLGHAGPGGVPADPPRRREPGAVAGDPRRRDRHPRRTQDRRRRGAHLPLPPVPPAGPQDDPPPVPRRK